MNKNLLDKMEKWHSICLLKGVDIESESYDIREVMELIDTLEGYIQDNPKFYQAAMSLRQMSLTLDDLDNYEELLSDRWREQEKNRRAINEVNNAVLKELKFKYKFAESNDDITVRFDEYTTEVVLKNGITVKIKVNEYLGWRHNWNVQYSWVDPGTDNKQCSVWTPRGSSVKSPKWFPDHWKTGMIHDARHMAYYVAWKLTHGRAKDMGRVPVHTKHTATVESVDDIKNITAKVKTHA